MSMPEIEPERIRFEETLPGGWTWSHILKRGTTLRVTDPEGGANVSALLYNAQDPLERYNMADTLKAQHTAYLTTGTVCYSDMGRILVSVTADTCGWHDTIAGVSNAALVADRYGARTYQEARNAFHRNGLDALLVELGKHGLGRRDLVANLNLFSKVTVDESGAMAMVPGHSAPGNAVDLRAEMDTLVVLCALQHPMDPNPAYDPKPAQLTVWRSDPPEADDPCRVSCEQNARGFINTERYAQ